MRTTDPIPIASIVSTTSHTTAPDQGGSGRSAYATIREHNRDTALTNDVERPTAYTISVCYKRHRSLKIILQSTPYPSIPASEPPRIVLPMASVVQTPQEFVSANRTAGAS